MKRNHFAAFVAILAIGMVAALASAKGASAGGLKGTISSIGSNFFYMTLAGNDPGADTMVVCDAGTQFVRRGVPVPPSTIQVGMTVAVKGQYLRPYQMAAYQVNIVSDAPAKKSK